MAPWVSRCRDLVVRNGAKADETLIIRQEYEDREHAEVMELTFGQVYDLIDGLNRAVESK
jgi:hypothetical protein